MNEATSTPAVPSLIESCIGMEDVATTVAALPRDELERLAGSAIALSRLHAKGDFGNYARRMIQNGITRLWASLQPLDAHTLHLVKTSL